MTHNPFKNLTPLPTPTETVFDFLNDPHKRMIFLLCDTSKPHQISEQERVLEKGVACRNNFFTVSNNDDTCGLYRWDTVAHYLGNHPPKFALHFLILKPRHSRNMDRLRFMSRSTEEYHKYAVITSYYYIKRDYNFVLKFLTPKQVQIVGTK